MPDLLPIINARQWQELPDLLYTAMSGLPGENRPFPPYVDSRPVNPSDIQAAAQTFLRRHESVAMLACLEWSKSGQWPEMSNDVSICAREILASVADFINSMIVGTRADPKTIFVFPPVPRERVLAWLFTDWWGSVGFFKTVWRAGRRAPHFGARGEPR